MSVANINPASISFKKSVTFTTVDQNTGNKITEGYTVNGPTSASITATAISGNKLVIPLTTTSTSTNGSPFLKIWLPGTGNTMYLTYCVQNSTMADGFYDYQTGVPATYLAALQAWTSALYSKSYAGPTTRSLKFTVYGSSSNQPTNARTFYLNFTGSIGTTSSTSSSSSSS